MAAEAGNRLATTGRIEAVLDAAKARGFRSGENPAAWRGHLSHLLPKRAKLTRGHHAAMGYQEIPALVAKLRQISTVAAMALEFAILTAARSGEVYHARCQRSVGSGSLDCAGGKNEGRAAASRPAFETRPCDHKRARRSEDLEYAFPSREGGGRSGMWRWQT